MIVRAEIDYRSPLSGDDEIDISVEALEFGKAKIILGQEMIRVSDEQVCAKVRLVTCCAKDGKVIPVPVEFRAIFE